jgi:DNA-binding MarR family transcriptional regulator
VYLRFQARRDKGEPRLTPQAQAVLQHLSFAGPLTVSEASAHFHRAQSATSEIFDALEAKGLVERMPDARDRRRHLVWLTPGAEEALARERRVLDESRLAQAFARMRDSERAALLQGMRALVRESTTNEEENP